MSRGYGLSITPLQLAHAYATVAALGIAPDLVPARRDAARGERALDPGVRAC